MSQLTNRSNIAFYAEKLEAVGGIETWLYYVSIDLSKYHDITVFYGKADPTQIKRLEDNGIKCIKYIRNTGETFDILFKSYSGDPDITAKHYIHTIHACFSELPQYKFSPWEKVDRYLTVSERAKESYLELFPDEKLPIDVVPNYVPTITKFTPKPSDGTIRMVMASRLTAEKGLVHMIQMTEKFDEMGLDYHIDLHTIFPKIPGLDKGNVTFLPQELGIDFTKYHYLIQLSDSEAYCYSVHEALASGTAVITQDLPAFKGIVRHGYNGYIYPNIDDIAKVPLDFEYEPTGSVNNWLKYIESVLK